MLAQQMFYAFLLVEHPDECHLTVCWEEHVFVRNKALR